MWKTSREWEKKSTSYWKDRVGMREVEDNPRRNVAKLEQFVSLKSNETLQPKPPTIGSEAPPTRELELSTKFFQTCAERLVLCPLSFVLTTWNAVHVLQTLPGEWQVKMDRLSGLIKCTVLIAKVAGWIILFTFYSRINFFSHCGELVCEGRVLLWGQWVASSNHK